MRPWWPRHWRQSTNWLRRKLKKIEKWELLCEEGKRKVEIETKRALAEDYKSAAKLLAEENKIMMMNQSEMDEITLE